MLDILMPLLLIEAIHTTVTLQAENPGTGLCGVWDHVTKNSLGIEYVIRYEVTVYNALTCPFFI